ncbi:MAG: prepilin-type N-terminal cleavage/methylation domain-containing protein [Sedimentisphaerales bacterium]|nr:prepilin-type N-terminal cleavage/methylation domain-containing protein [Sedimentisphaerales bacterium]
MKINNCPRPNQAAPPRAGRRRCAGLSLLEVLISLSIAALLLAATAMAFEAALTSYKANYDMAMTGMSTRNGLYQMCTAIRSAWNDPDYDTIDVSFDGNQIDLVDANGRNLVYRYDVNSRRLQVNIDGAASWYTLLDNVYPVNDGEGIFSASPPQGAGFEFGTVGCVEIRFRIVEGDDCRVVSVAVVPRNVVYAN